MDNIAGSKPALVWAVHISAALLVALWLFPTIAAVLDHGGGVVALAGPGL